MAAIRIKLDQAGMMAMLKSDEVAAAVHAAAEAVADRVRDALPEPLPVVVDDYETDRAASSVTVKHPSALALQAKYGTLTRAAAAGDE